MTKWRDPSERTRSVYLVRLCPALLPEVEEAEARGAADCDRNRLTDNEPTDELPTYGLNIPGKDGCLGATASGGGDEVHGRDGRGG